MLILFYMDFFSFFGVSFFIKVANLFFYSMGFFSFLILLSNLYMTNKGIKCITVLAIAFYHFYVVFGCFFFKRFQK